MVRIRQATAGDAGFLVKCLAMAADWRPGQVVRAANQVLSDPAIAHYVEGWPRTGDFGVVAEDDHPIGAAWWRYLSGRDPGYGYVEDGIPELSIAVAAELRGSGVGRLMLQQLIAEAQSRDLPGVSLSVEVDNPARRLYTTGGFSDVAHTGGAITMLWTPCVA